MGHQRMNGTRTVGVVSALILLLAGVGAADIRLPAVVGDNMVLQSGGKVAIWGWADPGEEVAIRMSWQSNHPRVTEEEDGKWMLKI